MGVRRKKRRKVAERNAVGGGREDTVMESRGHGRYKGESDASKGVRV